MRRFLAFAGDCVLVAHNARFDMAFLDAETMRLTGRRVAATVLDTVGLARCLLGRRPANLAALAYRFATDAKPCHRALPDAEATAEILVQLLGLAQERGARTVGDVVELAATKPRRVHRKRSLAFGAPQRPGVYLFRDVHDQVLYVGRARDLRARLRSYFRSDRQRPAVESALAALDRIDWQRAGLRARGGPRGAAADPRAAAAGERTLGAARPVPLPAPQGRLGGVQRAADRARADQEPSACPARREGAAGGRVGDARRRAAAAARASSRGWPATSASRTPRGCATGSPRSRR